MRKELTDLSDRVRHFKHVYAYMLDNNRTCFLEQDWFDDVQELSIGEVKEEIEIAQDKLNHSRCFISSNILKSMRRLFHRL